MDVNQDVTARTVAALVREQFPQWGDAEVRPVRSVGTINAAFRIGDAGRVYPGLVTLIVGLNRSRWDVDPDIVFV